MALELNLAREMVFKNSSKGQFRCFFVLCKAGPDQRPPSLFFSGGTARGCNEDGGARVGSAEGGEAVRHLVSLIDSRCRPGGLSEDGARRQGRDQ